MAKPSRLPSVCAERTYFVGTETFQRKIYFHNGPLAPLLVETIYNYRAAGKFLLHSFVIMPDHLHLLLTPGPGMTLERSLQMIKGGFSYRVKKELQRDYEIWQRGFTDRRVRDAAECVGIIEYIHQNPVKAKLVQKAEEYEFSSANLKFEMDELPEYLRG